MCVLKRALSCVGIISSRSSPCALQQRAAEMAPGSSGTGRAARRVAQLTAHLDDERELESLRSDVAAASQLDVRAPFRCS